jgi:hypothetical protein
VQVAHYETVSDPAPADMYVQVTVLERQQAARLSATGNIKPSTIGFGTHIPVDKQAAAVEQMAAAGVGGAVGQPSYCRQALMQEVAAIRQRQLDAAAAAEAELYARNPDTAYWAPRGTLPTNPALQQAQATWAAATAGACSSTCSTALLGGLQPQQQSSSVADRHKWYRQAAGAHTQ